MDRSETWARDQDRRFKEFADEQQRAQDKITAAANRAAALKGLLNKKIGKPKKRKKK